MYIKKIKKKLYFGNFYFKEGKAVINTYIVARGIGLNTDITKQTKNKLYKYLESLITEENQGSCQPLGCAESQIKQ